MGKRKTVRPEELVPGFYVAFGSDLGDVGFFKVVDVTERWARDRLMGPLLERGEVDPIHIWGLSRWRGTIRYRTRGMALQEWLAQQPRGVQFRADFDRTDWPMQGVG